MEEDGEREIVELWRDDGENPNWENWSAHLDTLIRRLEEKKINKKIPRRRSKNQITMTGSLYWQRMPSGNKSREVEEN